MMVTFLHIAKNIEGNPSILLMPVGLTALSNFIRERGFDSEIINLAVEEKLNNNFNIIEYLTLNRRKIICLDLHWHYQSNKVITLARILKKNIPDSRVILGGFTASFFAEQILEGFKEIDFVIKGDAEIPLLKLLRVLRLRKNNFSSVPNLVWREKNKLVVNRQSYKVGRSIIDSLNFTDFSTVKNFNYYSKMIAKRDSELMPSGSKEERLFHFLCGRGCLVNCSFCGGSNSAQKIINVREGVIFINPESAMANLERAVKSGLTQWSTSFDPFTKRTYYAELFKKIRSKKLNLGLIFDCWSIPTKCFIDDFSRTFDMSKSKIVLSPDCGSDSVRRINKGYYFSNKELLSSLKYIFSKKIAVDLYFTAGLPSEKKDDLVKTLSFINFIKNLGYKDIQFFSASLEFDPASPWFINRDEYGVSSDRKTFLDYYRQHKNKTDGGYSTRYLKRNEISGAIRLMKSVVKCKKTSPRFLEILSGTLFAVDYYDFSRVYLLCEACENFKRCFN
jgi:radical SAM superfamily enzyme YgiQ (UPF0313 family)